MVKKQNTSEIPEQRPLCRPGQGEGMNGLGAAFSSVPEGDEELDRVIQADRRFFERFPQRRHRLRWASKAEITQYHHLHGHLPKTVCGYRCAIAVRCRAPGVRVRVWLLWPEDRNPSDVGEMEAAHEFHCAT